MNDNVLVGIIVFMSVFFKVHALISFTYTHIFK